MSEIDDFRDDDYKFLMNSYPVDITVSSFVYPSVEHAFQALKTDDWYYKDQIRDAVSARDAKRIGRTAPLRPNWDNMRLQVMEALIEQKFENEDLARKLIQTGTATLVSGGDEFWGMVDGHGENHLGKILMKVRGQLMKDILDSLKESSRSFLQALGWRREPNGDDLFNECWVRDKSPNCYFDLESAMVHQLKAVASTTNGLF